MVQRLPTKQTRLISTFRRTPKLKVVVIGIFDAQSAFTVSDDRGLARTFLLCDCRQIQVHKDSLLWFRRSGTEQNEPPAGVHRYRLDAPHPHRCAKAVLAPRETLIGRVYDMIRWLLVVDEYDDRAGIPKFPHMCVFVYFLPCETAVSREEDVTISVSGKTFPDIADGEHELYHLAQTRSVGLTPTAEGLL